MSNRREFIRTVVLSGLSGWGAIFGCPSASAQIRSENLSVPLAEIPRRWWKPLAGNKVQCFICPLNCVLSDGQICGCNTRLNVKGRLMTMAYGNPCIISIDPVEKLPLHHFLPGSQTLSIATAGCNLRCLYCQNWQQSQVRPDQLWKLLEHLTLAEFSHCTVCMSHLQALGKFTFCATTAFTIHC